MRNGRLEGPTITSRFPVAFRLPAFASRSSDSRRGLGPPSRSAYRTRQSESGPRRGYHVPHARAMTGVGALYTPRTTVLAPVWTDCPAGACRSSTASPSTPFQQPITRGSALRGINEGSSTSPVRSSPHPRPPGWNGPPLRLSPELRTPPTKSRTTHVGAGTGHRARTSNNAHDISRTSNLTCLLNACDLVSQTRPVFPSPAAARMERAAAWAFPRASHPADQEPDDARQGEDRPSKHGPGTTRSTSHPLILQSVVHSLRATSRRSVQRGSAGLDIGGSCSSCGCGSRRTACPRPAVRWPLAAN